MQAHTEEIACIGANYENLNLTLSKTAFERTQEKLYNCSYCDKAFDYSCHLKVHKQAHTEEIAFACANDAFIYTNIWKPSRKVVQLLTV